MLLEKHQRRADGSISLVLLGGQECRGTRWPVFPQAVNSTISLAEVAPSLPHSAWNVRDEPGGRNVLVVEIFSLIRRKGRNHLQQSFLVGHRESPLYQSWTGTWRKPKRLNRPDVFLT